MNKEAKSPARLYGEKTLTTLAAKFCTKKLAEALAENDMAPSDMFLTPDADATDAHLAMHHEAGRLVLFKLLFMPDFPQRQEVLDAIIPPFFDSGKVDADSDEGRRMARRVMAGSMGLLYDMLSVYVHEIGHRVAGEAMGGEGRISVIAMPQLAMFGDEGYGVAFNLSGGRCMFKDPERFTPEQRAVISVAGHMAEKLCFPLSEKDAVDVDFWLRRFEAIHNDGPPSDGEEKKDGPAYHSGSYEDAKDFYTNAPSGEARRAAVEHAGRIIVEARNEILPEAISKVLLHVRTLGDVLKLMTTAMELAEGAAIGNYGEATIEEKQQ